MTVRGARRWVVALLLLVPALAWAGRLFQWTDKKGQVHVTDNLWEVPPEIRQRYLELIEEEARSKYTIAQIRDMKEAGDWPPLEFIRPKAFKKPDAEVNGLKLPGDDADLQRALADEYRFQWNSYYEERRALTDEKSSLETEVSSMTQGLDSLRQMEAATGVPPAYSKVPEAQKELAKKQARLDKVNAALAALPAREAQLWMGQRSYGHAGEDGGLGNFGPGSR